METILVAGDFHVFCRFGLLHPRDWKRYGVTDGQEKGWVEFNKLLEKIYKDHSPSMVIYTGDLVDGPSWRNRAAELIGTRPSDQRAAAMNIINHIGIDVMYMVSGTAYHSGGSEQDADIAEEIMAKELGAVYAHRICQDIGGVQFDIRHHCSTSKLEKSRTSMIHGEWVDRKEWCVDYDRLDLIPRVVVRGHTHYWSFASGNTAQGNWIAFTNPGLQMLGGDYGARKCSGVIHFGMSVITINRGDVRCQPYINRSQSLLTG
jgi:predicted phosphodiesterase